MRPKTIAKLFGAVAEDGYGSPQRDATLPGWFRWYLDHMPVRENVYGTLIDIGLTGTQANVIIERIWPQVASIQQEAIDLAKAGNESGAIAKLNEAASLAERLAREAAEHERLLGRGIEPEPPRRMEERDMAAQAEKADWPRQVVERDNYILINDYLGAGYAQANPELVETLVRIAADYLLARPDVAFDNLWAYTYDALKKMYPARERGIAVGGSIMKKRLQTADARPGRTYEQHFGRIADREPAPFTFEEAMHYLNESAADINLMEIPCQMDGIDESTCVKATSSDVNKQMAQRMVEIAKSGQSPSEVQDALWATGEGDRICAEAAATYAIENKVAVGWGPLYTLASAIAIETNKRLSVSELQAIVTKARGLIESGEPWQEAVKQALMELTKAGGMMEASTIAKMFGARERLQAVIPDGEMPIRRPVVMPDVGEVLAPSHYDLWWGLLDHLGDYDLSLVHCKPGSITALERMWDSFVAEYWPEAQEKYAGKPNSFQRADVQEQFFERYNREIRIALFGSDIQWWEIKEARKSEKTRTDTHYEDEVEVPGYGWVARDEIRPYDKALPYGEGTHYEDEVEVPNYGWVAKDKIRLYGTPLPYGSQKTEGGIFKGANELKPIEPPPGFFGDEGLMGDWPYYQLDKLWPSWRDLSRDIRDTMMEELRSFVAAYSADKAWYLLNDVLIASEKKIGELQRQYAGDITTVAPVQTPSQKVGGGTMPKLLSLRSILMAAASLGDLLSLLRKVKEPTKEVSAAIKKLEDMVAKYDEGAKLEDVNTAAMKRILTQLKKLKPTKEHPRTRVLKAVKLLEDLLKTKVSSAVLQASIVQVARILKAVEEPTEEVKDAIKLADQLAKSYEEGGPKKYGKVVSVEGMTKLLKMLEAIEEKPDPVVKAVAALKKLLGAEEEKPVAPGERGTLPSYGLAKLEAALKPGVYRARLIRAGEALDGTTWPEDQLKVAFEKGYFEGVPVNAISYTGQYGPDIEYHLPLDTEIAGKVVGNQVGFIKDAKWDDEEHAGYGYVYITDSERRNLIDAMLEQGIDAPGMSIYADGMKDENDIVTGINGVTSMDLVTFPAADGAILSQALTASVKEWGMLRKKLQAGEPVASAVVPDAGGTITPDGGAIEPKQARDLDIEWDALWEDLESALIPYINSAIENAHRALQEMYGLKISAEMAPEDWEIEHFRVIEEVNKQLYDFWKALVSYGRSIDKATLISLGKTIADAAISKRKSEIALSMLGQRIYRLGDKTKTGGGIMSPTALEQRLDVVEKISQGLTERVAQTDTDGMIEAKLQASKLPEKVQVALRGQLLGKQLTEEEVDSFIKFQQGITDDLATELAATAHVTLGGGVLPGEGKDTLEGALTALFKKQK